MAANVFIKTLGEMIFSSAKRPGRYLSGVFQSRLDKEFRKMYQEQMMYFGAYLAHCYKSSASPPLDYEKISKFCNDMSLEEHKILVNGEYIEQTYKILHALHKISRNMSVLYDPSTLTTSTAILDPNSFPLHTS